MPPLPRGWQPFDFQREVWAHLAAGRSGLLHATTGAGKTYAVWMGALQRRVARPAAPLQVLWITPMRALAADTTRALQVPLADLPAQDLALDEAARMILLWGPEPPAFLARAVEPESLAA